MTLRATSTENPAPLRALRIRIDGRGTGAGDCGGTLDEAGALRPDCVPVVGAVSIILLPVAACARSFRRRASCTDPIMSLRYESARLKGLFALTHRELPWVGGSRVWLCDGGGMVTHSELVF
jgi:hypothetical protein